MAAKAAVAAHDLAFGWLPLTEVEAILLTALIASLLAAWGVVTQRVVVRRLTTIQHLSKQDADRDMINAKELFNSLSAPGGKLSNYASPSDLTSKESNAVRLVLNDHELMAVGVWSGIFDLNIVRQFAKSTKVRDWSRAAPYVYKLRAELDNPFIYYEFESLAQMLQDGKRPKRKIWTRLLF